MSKLMKKSFLVFLSLIFIYSRVVFSDIVQSSKYQFYFDAPSNWQIVEKGYDGKSFRLSDSSGRASISVDATFQEDFLTIQQLKKPIVSSYLDDWMIKFDRKGTEDEKRKANVKDSALIVFSRYETDSNGLRTEIIDGHYFFVTGNYGYVIRVRTPTSQWGGVQVVLKQIISTFGHGQYVGVDATSVVKPVFYEYGWEGPSGRPNRSNYVDTLTPTATIYQSFWSKEVLSKSLDSTFAPVVDSRGIYIYDGTSVIGYDAIDGHVLFNFPVSSLLDFSLVLSNGILYFAKSSESGAVIYGVSVDSGLVLFSTATSHNVTSITVDSGKLFITGESSFSQYDALTGILLKSRSFLLESRLLPVFSDGFVCLLTTKGLVCLDSETLEKRWSVDGVSVTKMAAKDHRLFLVLESDEVQCLSLKSGTKIWEFSDETFVHLQPDIVLLNSKLVLLSQQKNMGVVFSLSQEFGKLIWKSTIHDSVLSRTGWGVGLNDSVLVLTKEGLYSYSEVSGGVSPVLFLKRSTEKQSILSFLPYKNVIYTFISKKGLFFLDMNK